MGAIKKKKRTIQGILEGAYKNNGARSRGWEIQPSGLGRRFQGDRGQAGEAGTGVRAEECQSGRIPFTWTLSGWCHTERSGPHSSCVPRDGVREGGGGEAAPAQPV